jgi:predicted O-linked N-acetylglucosamine transferase (SPINDLY family)
MLAVRFGEGERGMKTVWIASLAAALSSPVWAQSTIYKHVDDSGRVTYSNKPMKGAVVVDLEPLTTIPSSPAGSLVASKPAAPAEKEKAELRAEAKPVAIVTPLASVDPQVQKRRDEGRRKILEAELEREEQTLVDARKVLLGEQQNPQLIAAVRTAQQASEPTAAELVEFRKNIEKASGRIRGLQATVAEHEKNVEALKKELGALKP